MPGWNSQANDIFLDALDIAAPLERQAFVERACSGDPEILAQVQSLLKANHEVGEFLEPRHAAAIATPYMPTEDIPRTEVDTHVGRYKLLEKIAEGGMGVVYVAEQSQPIRRKVALKIVKPGMDSRQVIARFEAERQALALMDHPNIARVLDAGATETGHPYFVMELVRGVAITEFCEREQLTIPERLRLVVSVCRAVQHAHQKGIIHRDLKPSNVLVTLHDGVPVAKVIDFGIAKALHQPLTEKTVYTGFGHMVGTPMYMSPEQAEMSGLDVDTRSDVYSLGVLLYELLTGVPPFDPETLKQAGLAKLQQVLRETEPSKPSARISTLKGNLGETLSDRRRLDRRRLEQALRGDLDWVVMKALEKDRNRRYSSPAELADDLERHLERLPVVAGPPSWRYKTQKFVRRHRVLLAVSSLVLLAMVAGTAFSAWYALEAAAARDRARQSEKLANERLALLQSEQRSLKAEQQKSGRRFELARQAVARLMDNVATYQLLGSPELTEFRDSLLHTADEFYSQLIRENPDDAELYLARAGVREQLRRS
ncbi:MAG: serine/threonine protein kinase, partial [Pirellulaceae bacterium]|nr:serine/threonine protein kinase [Pirellulaceae bacterium]